MTIAALRYNNPGDISLPMTGWTGGGHIVGIPGQVGYAEFPTMKIGFDAMVFRVKSYIVNQHRNTIRKIGLIYAQDPRWGNDVAEIAGIGVGVALDASNESEMQLLCRAIMTQEMGRKDAGIVIAELDKA